MKYLNTIKSLIQGIPFWIGMWLLFVLGYSLSLKYSFHIKELDYSVYIIQLIADILIGTFAYLAYLRKTEKNSKYFYLINFISLIPGLFANEIYNVLFNIIGLKSISNSINLSWTIAYTSFLIIQIYAWVYLLSVNGKQRSKLLSFLPYFQSAIIILISLISIKVFRTAILNEIGISGSINSILEIGLFVLLSVSLSRTKNRSLINLEMGFLLLIGFNLAHRFSYHSGHYFKIFGVIWMVSLVIIIFGLFRSSRSNNEEIEFYDKKSIHVFSSGIFIMFASFVMLLAFAVEYLISSVEIIDLSDLDILIQNVPSVLVFSYSLSLMLGKVVAGYLSRPLEQVAKRIDYINENQLALNKLVDKKFKIFEIEKLDKFILKTIAELQVANRVKSEFLMNMSHDFRTPASGIYHMSRSIHKRLDDQKLKKLQQHIVDSSEQLMNFLEDVLDYSRLEGDKYKLKIQEFCLASLVDEVILFLLPKANEKQLNLSVLLIDDLPKYRGDKFIINRIILNLVSNAIKFTDKGFVKVSISGRRIDANKYSVIEVQDSGIGIDEAHQSAIFDPFFRVQSAETAQQSGLGLGLSNVNLMLKKIGGRITLESKLGVGSIFKVYLPNEDI